MFQIRYEHYSESYPKFRWYKIRPQQQVQKFIYHKSLSKIIDYAQEYPRYKHIFMLDESRFNFFRFDVFEHFDKKFTLNDLQKIIKYRCDSKKKEYNLDWEKLVSYIDTIYINWEEKKFVIWKKWDIFFRLYIVYIQKKSLNLFKSTYWDLSKMQDINIVPQSFHSLMFLRNTLNKESFLILYITDAYCKAIKVNNWFYEKIEVLNLGLSALKQMYNDNDIQEYRYKSDEQIDSNALAKSLVKKTLEFYIQLITKRLHDNNFTWTDIILVSPIIKNWHFVELFNQEYLTYCNNYIVPFHHSEQLESYGNDREPEDMDWLIYINRKKLCE